MTLKEVPTLTSQTPRLLWTEVVFAALILPATHLLDGGLTLSPTPTKTSHFPGSSQAWAGPHLVVRAAQGVGRVVKCPAGCPKDPTLHTGLRG